MSPRPGWLPFFKSLLNQVILNTEWLRTLTGKFKLDFVTEVERFKSPIYKLIVL